MKTSHFLPRALCIVTISCGFAQNVDDYLDYGIPPNVQTLGPLNTRRPDEKWLNYFIPATETSKRILIARETYKAAQLIGRQLYKNDKQHGVQREWHLNGQPSSEAPYRNGVMHGIFKHWDEAGRLVGQYQIINGSGTIRIYNTAGKLVREKTIANGQGNGLQMEIDPVNGSMSLNWRQGGQLVGKCFTFYQDGNLSDVLCFSIAGLRHGPRIDFSKEGGVLSKQWHVKNKEVTEAEYAAAAPGDPSLPVYFADPTQYKQFVDTEIQALLNHYRNLPAVKIPLEFDQTGNPVPAP